LGSNPICFKSGNYKKNYLKKKEENQHTLIAMGAVRDFSICRVPSLLYRGRRLVGGSVSMAIVRC